MSALLGGLARSFCHRCFSYFYHLSHMIALAGVARPGLLSFLLPNSDGLDAMTHVCLHVFSCLSQMIPLLDGLATTFCQRLVYVSFHLSPTSLRCSTAWPDHAAKGLSCLFFASQMSAFLGGLARSFCQMFAFNCFPMYPR